MPWLFWWLCWCWAAIYSFWHWGSVYAMYLWEQFQAVTMHVAGLPWVYRSQVPFPTYWWHMLQMYQIYRYILVQFTYTSCAQIYIVLGEWKRCNTKGKTSECFPFAYFHQNKIFQQIKIISNIRFISTKIHYQGT